VASRVRDGLDGLFSVSYREAHDILFIEIATAHSPHVAGSEEIRLESFGKPNLTEEGAVCLEHVVDERLCPSNGRLPIRSLIDRDLDRMRVPPDPDPTIIADLDPAEGWHGRGNPLALRWKVPGLLLHPFELASPRVGLFRVDRKRFHIPANPEHAI